MKKYLNYGIYKVMEWNILNGKVPDIWDIQIENYLNYGIY